MRVVIGEGSCGIAAGAGKVREAITALMNEKENFVLGSTGCIGMCFLEPIVDIYEGKTLLRRLVHVGAKDLLFVSKVNSSEMACFTPQLKEWITSLEN